jgi:transposase
MGQYDESFVAFDVAKKKHAVAIAEGGRTGEVRFLGDVETVRFRSSGRSRDWRTGTTVCTSALKPGRRDTGFTARFTPSATDCMVVAPA